LRPWELEKEKQVEAEKVGMEAVEEGEEREMEGEYAAVKRKLRSPERRR